MNKLTEEEHGQVQRATLNQIADSSPHVPATGDRRNLLAIIDRLTTPATAEDAELVKAIARIENDARHAEGQSDTVGPALADAYKVARALRSRITAGTGEATANRALDALVRESQDLGLYDEVASKLAADGVVATRTHIADSGKLVTEVISKQEMQEPASPTTEPREWPTVPNEFAPGGKITDWPQKWLSALHETSLPPGTDLHEILQALHRANALRKPGTGE